LSFPENRERTSSELVATSVGKRGTYSRKEGVSVIWTRAIISEGLVNSSSRCPHGAELLKLLLPAGPTPRKKSAFHAVQFSKTDCVV